MLKLYRKNPRPPRWTYDVVATKCYHIDLGEYLTYGIRASGSGEAATLDDVSPLREAVVEMAESFNRNRLSLVHLRDVIQNMLP